MMKKITFTKMVASGNDFVIIEKNNLSAIRYSLSAIAKMICGRKLGIGADGVLLLEKSKKADIRMRIFNADGSEAEMCGNGARCVALWAKLKIKKSLPKAGPPAAEKILKIETKAGVIEAQVINDNVKIKLTNPKDIKIGILLKDKSPHSPPFFKGGKMKVDFINTGVPHAVVFVEGLEKIDVFNFGRAIRYHNKFKPSGTNVNFVEVINKDSIRVRTYERGVEDETLACGTGSVACALLYVARELVVAKRACFLSLRESEATEAILKNRLLRPSGARNDTFSAGNKINVHTQSGEILKVYFDRIDNRLSNVWLEGKAKIVYEGEYYV